MPYIAQDRREKYDLPLLQLLDRLTPEVDTGNIGDVNYCISFLVVNLFREKKSYKRANDLMGALTGVQLEFYRKEVAPYEDVKIRENGDI
jgi:hypothetical protein